MMIGETHFLFSEKLMIRVDLKYRATDEVLFGGVGIDFRILHIVIGTGIGTCRTVGNVDVGWRVTGRFGEIDITI